MLFCINLPESPAENPKYADIKLSINNVMLHQGDVPQIGVAVYFTQHFHTVTLRTSCNVFDTSFSTGSLEEYDTLYFSPQFDIAGPCTVFVVAQFKDNGLKDKCDTLPLYVLSKETGIYFISTQAPVKTVTGKTDTLVFVTRASSGTILPPEYKITALPSTGITLTPLYSQQKDTVRVVSVASVADTFTVMIVASALYGNSFVEDSAFTGMRVNTAGMLLPSIVSIPNTIPVGTADTLIFTVDNSNIADKLTIKHTTRTPLDSAVFSVLPTRTDSVLIHIKPSQACTADVGIIISNSTRSDTSWYQVKLGIVDTIDTSDTLDTLLWNKSEIAITAIEGKPLKHDLRQYFIKPQTGSVIFSSDMGTVTDTTWEWTPPYGTVAATSATISATNGVTISPIILTISITPSDTTKPELSLVDTVPDGKKISAPEFTVNCIAKDSEAGIDSVSISYGSTTIPAVLQLDSTFSGFVSGLQNGKPTEITVTAIDKSIRKNSRILKFTVTYDSTVPGIAPEITTPLPATALVIEGSTLSLRIEASGTPAPSYQWYKNDVVQPGQSSAEYSKNNVTADDSGSYYVIINNGIGNNITSTRTAVTIRLRATITQDPVSTTVNEGGTGSFTVTAVGEEPLSYQWLKNGELITGATSSTYTITNADTIDNSNIFTCIVNNSISKDTSTAGILTVTKKPVYQVSFVTGDGVTTPAIQQIAEGGKIIQPAAPTRNGYDYIGWYKDTTTINAWNFSTDVVNTPVTLYAKWSLKSYTITYNLNNGTNGNNPTSYAISNTAITLTNATKDGYDFAGWFENSGLTGTAVTSIPAGSTGDKVFWAKWTEKSYSITYNNLNGGTNGNNPVSYTITSSTITLANASRNGYAFVAWYDNAGLTGTAISTIPDGSTGNKSFWAKWELSPPQILQHPQNKTSPINETVTFEVVADNAVDYQWYKGNSIIDGATGSNYSTSPTVNDINSPST